jgi:hypothetical protein
LLPRLLVLCAASALLLLGATTSGPAAAATAKLAVCKLPTSEQRTFGPTYVETIRQAGTSCTRAKKLVRAFQKCRRAGGGVKGRCRRKVEGYSCTEQRATNDDQLSAKVTCRKGPATVLHTYTELFT